jgi:TP901 family phage tail tape measure protein
MATLRAAVTATNAQLQRQQGAISAADLAMIRYTARMEALRASMLRVGVAAAALGAGIGFAAIGAAVSDAAKLQQILLSIKNETGASDSQIGKFYNTAFAVANQNGMTPVQAGEILRTISRLTSGQFTLDQMMKIAPTVAGYASSVHFNRPDISVDDAAKTGIQTAHLFRAYQPGQLTKLLDSVYRLSGLMAESPDAALRQMSYYVPLFKNLGIGNETSIAMMALLDRMGFQNKVGTNVRAEVLAALGPLQLTAHAQAGKIGYLKEMGLLDAHGKFAWNNKDGSVNFFGELSQLGTWVSKELKEGVTRADIARIMMSAFGKQGGTIAALFGDPQVAGILKGIRDYLRNQNVGLEAAKRNRDTGLGFQFTRAADNLKAVMTELGYPWLQSLTDFFRGMADDLHTFQEWLHHHRDAEKIIGGAFASVTGLLGAAAAIGATIQLANLVGLTSGLGILGRTLSFFVDAGAIEALVGIPPGLNMLRTTVLSLSAALQSGGIISATATFLSTFLALPAAILAAAAAAGYFLSKMDDYSGGPRHFGPTRRGQPSFGKPQRATTHRNDYGHLSRPVHFGPERPVHFGPQQHVSTNQAVVHIAQVVLPAGTHPRDAGRVLGDFLGGIIEDPRLILGRSGSIRTSQFMPVVPIATG